MVEESSVFGAVGLIVIMNVDDDEFVVVNLQNPRKRNEAAWQKNRAKHVRYSGEGKPYTVGYRTYSHFIF